MRLCPALLRVDGREIQLVYEVYSGPKPRYNLHVGGSALTDHTLRVMLLTREALKGSISSSLNNTDTLRLLSREANAHRGPQLQDSKFLLYFSRKDHSRCVGLFDLFDFATNTL